MTDKTYTAEQVDACILAYQNGDLNYCRAGIVDLLTAYAATLKAAQGGVTEAMVEQAERGWYSHIGEHGLDGSAFRDRLRAALEAALSAEPAAPCSLNEAMEVMEVWADHGGQVHGEAAARLRALTDRIAPEPAAQPEDSRCPPTYRREEAVKALIGMGWTWDGKAWAEPAAQGEAIGYITADNLAVLKRDDGSAFGHMTAPIYSRARSSREIPVYTAPPAQPAERVPDPETACAMWIKPDTTEAESNAFLAGARAMLAATPAAPADGDGKEGVR